MRETILLPNLRNVARRGSGKLTNRTGESGRIDMRTGKTWCLHYAAKIFKDFERRLPWYVVTRRGAEPVFSLQFAFPFLQRNFNCLPKVFLQNVPMQALFYV